jgi:glycosyltransferase involved in cell wall biosynthesis
MRNSKIVIINQSTGYLTIDIVNAFASNYDEVTLIAGSIKESERKLDSKVMVDLIVSYNRNSSIQRLWTWLAGTAGIFFKLLFKYRDYKVVYITNPPMSYLCSLLLHNPYSIIVYDIYPEALKNIGIKDGSIFYKLWGRWNMRLFRKAETVFTLSDGMGSELSKYIDRSRIKVIYNWSASENIHPVPRDENKFIKDNNLEGMFIVLYSGNIGYTHNVESVIEVAEKLRSHEDIRFLFIGEGKKKEILQNKVREYGITNCIFMTWQSTQVLPFSLASADIGVVTLNDETATVSVPSKTYNLLAVGTPLMCIAPQSSELNRLVSSYGNGKCFDKNNIDGMAGYILRLHEDNQLRLRMSEASLEASKHFTYKNAMEYVQALP